jgi:sugar/nucleoside kinase (ribokinase family)
VRTLCFGEAIVDLICQRPVASFAEADAFVAHQGGVSANVAVTAARAGALVALAGGAGDDAWGARLHEGFDDANVGLEWFRLVGGQRTGLQFVTLDDDGAPSYELQADGVAAAVSGVKRKLPAAVAGTDALLFGSNMLAGKAEAALTTKAREQALELGHPVVFDASIDLGRWDSSGRAGSDCGGCVPGAFLVVCGTADARMITGESHPEKAAASLLAAGAQHVIVNLGTRGAILRAKGLRRDVPMRPVNVLSTVGASDVLLGVVLAVLGKTDFYPPAVAAALPDAVEAAARACERWGALE